MKIRTCSLIALKFSDIMKKNSNNSLKINNLTNKVSSIWKYVSLNLTSSTFQVWKLIYRALQWSVWNLIFLCARGRKKDYLFSYFRGKKVIDIKELPKMEKDQYLEYYLDDFENNYDERKKKNKKIITDSCYCEHIQIRYILMYHLLYLPCRSKFS